MADQTQLKRCESIVKSDHLGVTLQSSYRLFDSLDIDHNGTLNRQAFAKIGLTPTLAEVGAMIKEHDKDGSGELSFSEFCEVFDRVQSGSLPATTGLAKLIKAVWEDFIANANKPVPKNDIRVKVEKHQEQHEVDAGEGWAVVNGRWERVAKTRTVTVEVEVKKKSYKPGSLPRAKDLRELP